jgi:hypothetical protein
VAPPRFARPGRWSAVAKGRRASAGSAAPLSGPELDTLSTGAGESCPLEGPAASPPKARRRGRPALAVSERRTYRLNVALPPEALERLCARAQRAGERPSTYAGRVVMERLAAFQPRLPPSEAARAELQAAAEQLNRVLFELHLAGLEAPAVALDGADAQRLAAALMALRAGLAAARAPAGEQP